MYKVNAAFLPNISFYGTISHTNSWGHDDVVKSSHLLVLANEGSFHISFLGRCYEMEKDTVLFIPKNTPYSLKSKGTINHAVIHFDAEITAYDPSIKGKDATSDFFFIPTYIKADITVRSGIERVAELGTDNPLCELKRKVNLLRALMSISALSQSVKESQFVKKIKQYLVDHMAEKVSLEKISVEFGYTKQYLIRVFKKEMGKSPIHYLNEQRLLKSTAELLNEGKSIAEIARECGFDDYNYFSRAFRRRYGMSPREYRKMRIYN